MKRQPGQYQCLLYKILGGTIWKMHYKDGFCLKPQGIMQKTQVFSYTFSTSIFKSFYLFFKEFIYFISFGERNQAYVNSSWHLLQCFSQIFLNYTWNKQKKITDDWKNKNTRPWMRGLEFNFSFHSSLTLALFCCSLAIDVKIPVDLFLTLKHKMEIFVKRKGKDACS